MAKLGSTITYGELIVTGRLKLGGINNLEDYIKNHPERVDNPHSVTASQIGSNAILTEVKKVDGSGSGLDADLLDGQHASAFLGANDNAVSATRLNTARTISLDGDISGSVSFDGTSNVTITGVVGDDSHNHIISNVDGLQTELNTLQTNIDNATMADSDILNGLKNVDGSTSGLDADLLDGQHGSYYRDWTYATNKPDPTITLGGDLSGNITLTNLAGGTLTATVSDDSHNHIIGNIDGLQTELNTLQTNIDNATMADSDILTGLKNVDGSASGLDADLLDGQHGSHYLDWNNATNKPDPTITLGGDLSGNITLTNLASGTLTATVADDSHNHTIANVDGLQTALNGKSSTAHNHDTEYLGINATADDSDLLDGQHGSYYRDWNNATNKPDPTITLGGDASGSLTLTDLAGGTLTVTVANDSHTHNSQYYTETEADGRFLNNTGDESTTGKLSADGGFGTGSWTIKENADGSLGFFNG